MAHDTDIITWPVDWILTDLDWRPFTLPAGAELAQSNWTSWRATLLTETSELVIGDVHVPYSLTCAILNVRRVRSRYIGRIFATVIQLDCQPPHTEQSDTGSAGLAQRISMIERLSRKQWSTQTLQTGGDIYILTDLISGGSSICREYIASSWLWDFTDIEHPHRLFLIIR